MDQQRLCEGLQFRLGCQLVLSEHVFQFKFVSILGIGNESFCFSIFKARFGNFEYLKR